MPTQKGLTLTVVSQWELQIHPEFAHPDSSQYTVRSPNPNSPVPDHDPDSDYSSSKSDRILGRQSILAVYIPSVSGARFWLRYSINEGAATTSPWYYFKLFMNGRHITSWGANTITQARGQVMRGLFEPSKRWNYRDNGVVIQKGGAEVRPFFFAREDTERSAAEEGGLIEVMVFRARGRKRRMQKPEEFRCQDEWGIVMPTGGLLEKPQDAKFYDWHLRDPKDRPFATFQFHYRSWDSLISSQLIPADHARTLVPASPSLLSLNGHPHEQQSPPKADDDSNIKIYVDEMEQEDEYRDSVSSTASNTPWMTSVFDDKPDPGAKNPDKPAALFKLPRTTSSYPLPQAAVDVPLSRFAHQVVLNGAHEEGSDRLDDEFKDPIKGPPAPETGHWDAIIRSLPEIPTRTTSLNCGHGHSRTLSAQSNAISITPSLRSYVDRDTNSPEPFIGVASVMHVVATTFGLNDDSEKNASSTSREEPDVDTSVGHEAVSTMTPLKRPLGGVFDISNITFRKHRRSSPIDRLSPIKQSPILGSESSKSSPKEGSDQTGDANASIMANNTTTMSSLSEAEWMCCTPSPVGNKRDRVEHLWSPGMEKSSFRDSLDGRALKKKPVKVGIEDPEGVEARTGEGREHGGVRMRSGNWI